MSFRFFSSFKNNANFTKRKISPAILLWRDIATNVPEMGCGRQEHNKLIVKDKIEGAGAGRR